MAAGAAGSLVAVGRGGSDSGRILVEAYVMTARRDDTELEALSQIERQRA